MLDRIDRPHAAPRHITLGCELVIRDSTRPNKANR
jgi:DNA-binding LacI/PurR family transcriptional regulator